MQTKSTKMGESAAIPLPVIIAGAGPAGLVVALTLQKSGVPFVIYERAAPEKLCSNAGSGIDMAATAIQILDNDLGLAGESYMRPYEFMHVSDMKGKTLKVYRLNELGKKFASITDDRSFGFASRSVLQHALLDALGLKDEDGNIRDNDERLHCSVTVTGYENMDSQGFVRVDLSDGTTASGSALLACDGIHSAVRKCMHENVDDPLHYCGQECWWGKTTVSPGSSLDKELQKVATEEKMQDGNVSFMSVATRKVPGGFFSCEVSKTNHVWAFLMPNKLPPEANASNDLVRRGGTVLSEDKKRKDINELFVPSSGRKNELIKLIMESTPAEDITRAAFYDRQNLNLSYVDGRVALLGDAAHPQSPMMGQGANMAIVDGYVVATRLAAVLTSNGGSRLVKEALDSYDCKKRRKNNNSVIKKARRYGDWMVSTSRLACFSLKWSIKLTPPSGVVGELVSGDKSNKRFVASMREDLIK